MLDIRQLVLLFLLLLTFFLPSLLAPGHAAPRVSLPIAQAATVKEAVAPTRLNIPSIGLQSTIVPMGLDKVGNLDVPSGKSGNVGWYAAGTIPGEMGSAVLDAHVFAAFSRLHTVGKGDRIEVAMSDGTTRTFAVTKTKVFKLSDLSPQELYEQDGGRYLHLVTCAGTLTPDHSTYTHRLVVYATLVE